MDDLAKPFTLDDTAHTKKRDRKRMRKFMLKVRNGDIQLYPGEIGQYATIRFVETVGD